MAPSMASTPTACLPVDDYYSVHNLTSILTGIIVFGYLIIVFIVHIQGDTLAALID